MTRSADRRRLKRYKAESEVFRMKTSEEKKRYNQKYILEEKDHAIKRIVALAKDITAHGGGNIKFVKMEKKKND